MTAARVRFAALGELTVEVDGIRHPVRQRREGLILSLLIAAHGAAVAADRLITDIWADETPQRALASLQVGVSRLRSMIEPDRAPRASAFRLVSATGGYALRAQVDDVDVWSFEAAAEECLSGSDDDRIARAEVALSGWSGEPYAMGSEVESLRVEADRLRELRVAVLEARAGAMLGVGHHEAAARSLADLVPGHPFREEMWATLALAQYRSGRQADALATLRTLRERLAEDLGVDPSTEIRELELAILAQDAVLAAPKRIVLVAADRPVPATGPAGDPANPTESRARPERPGIVGRAAALVAVEQLVAGLAAGAGSALVITGEPGIGKSRLVDELVERAAAAGLQVAVGRSHDADVAPPFWPWLPVLRRIAPAEPAPEVAPEVARLLGGGDDVGSGYDGGAALRTYDAVCQLLIGAARRRPLLVVLEDLHWADASSLRLLAYASEALRNEPVALVVTLRPAEANPSDAQAAAMAGLARRNAERVTLTGLSGSEVGDLLSQRVGDHDPSLAAVLSRRTGGNPFYLIEMARLLAAGGTTDPAEVATLPVPEGVRDVIRLRLDRMPRPARLALDHASVAGSRIDPDLVAATTDLSIDDVLDQLDLCVASGLVVPDGTRYGFAHALTRECLYGDIPTGRRIRLHAELADALAARVETDPELLAEAAHHAWLAAPLNRGRSAQALATLRAAARQAEAQHAFPEALEWWRRAQSLCPDGPAVDPLIRYEVNRDTARAEFRLGLIDPARRSIDAAVTTARALGRWDLVPEAATSFAIAGSWSWREFGDVDQPMIETLLECLDHLPDGATKALVLACLQMEHYFAWDAEGGEEFGRRSVIMAREAGDPEMLLQVLLVRGLAGWGQLTPDERIVLAEEALRLPVAGETEVLALWQYGGSLHQAARPEESDAVMDRCFAAAERLRHTGSDVPIAWWRFMRAVEQESPDAAALGDAALDLHWRTGYIAMAELVGIHAIRRERPGTQIPAEVAATVARSRNTGFRALVAHATLEAGHGSEALDLLGPGPHPGERNYATLAAHCLRLAVCASTGRLAGVRETLPDVAPASGRVVTFGSVDSLGAVDYFLALGAYALGDRADAERYAAAAVELNARVGNRAWGRRSAALATELGLAAELRRVADLGLDAELA